VIIGHSMGGLVLRSACHIAQRLRRRPGSGRCGRWSCLGTPHHGAPLERGGRLLDGALGLSPYVRPFIATVNNGHMIEMQKRMTLSRLLYRIRRKSQPRHQAQVGDAGRRRRCAQRVTTDIATKGGQFDVMTIGMYEAPIWGKKGWLQALKTDAAYDVDDLLPAIRNGLSVDGKLYAAPFYGESSMLMYRKDLADKAGVPCPSARPGRRSPKPPPRCTTRPTVCTASACAASRAGATTWPS
jgi:hypothetical protein